MDPTAIFQLVSTGGALGFSIWMLSLFLNEKIVPKGRLDDQKAATKEAIDGWKASVEANNRLAEAWEARNKAETDLAQKLGLVKNENI